MLHTNNGDSGLRGFEALIDRIVSGVSLLGVTKFWRQNRCMEKYPIVWVCLGLGYLIVWHGSKSGIGLDDGDADHTLLGMTFGTGAFLKLVGAQ